MLCTTCACLGISLLVSNDSDAVLQDVDTPARYFWHDNAQILCFRHAGNIAVLERTAIQGCELCKVISTAIGSVPIAQDEVARQLPLTLYVGGPAQIGVALDSEEEGLVKLCALDVSRNSAHRQSTDLPSEIYDTVHADPASQHCTTLARQWFTTCTHNHECSSSPIFTSDSVTRFLRIGPNATDIHVVEFGPNEAPSSWVVLSYRWGDHQSVTLTQSSHAKLKRGICLHDLDATIRDAVFIARSLNLEYLWVDALCVFQDGTKEDWLIQSSKMQEVYEKSALALVAVDTSSVRDRILVTRHDQYISVSWDLNTSSDDHDSSNTVYLSQHWDPVQDKLIGPWSSRGWTLQEGLLPNRLLYYTATQMVWKCCEETRYERGRNMNPTQQIVDEFEEEGGRNFWSFDLFTKVKLMPWYVSTFTHDIRREKHRLWYELVTEYSARHLTNSSDRLVAISGLAAKYLDFLGSDRYLAGLWENDMVRGLLWQVDATKTFSMPESEAGMADTYHCPTWSWLGVTPGYTVSNDHAFNIDCKDLAEVQVQQVEYEHHSRPFGNVQKAVLSLRGHTIFFNRLYHAEWRTSTSLSAFERHISHLIEDEYASSAVDFAHESKFAAILMLKHFPSIDHRVDVLLLEAIDQNAHATSSFRRRGVVQLCYLSDKAKSLYWHKPQEHLSYRLGLSSGPRKAKYLSAKAVFEELRHKMWAWHQLTMV
ncbi:hypothetical protein LTR51_008638 [Lithohypha guttulata]|nr:hypothetical protein LTR51_008638 [Lithohypha guttulata]